MIKVAQFFGKTVDFEQTEEYVEVNVIYEVIEKIGMQEKIEEIEQHTEEIQEPAY